MVLTIIQPHSLTDTKGWCLAHHVGGIESNDNDYTTQTVVSIDCDHGLISAYLSPKD
jgi:hypothetical protein